MTNTLDSSLSRTTPPAEMQRKRSAGHIVAIVIGCLMLLPGLGLVTGGGAIAIAQAVATDDDGVAIEELGCGIANAVADLGI